MFVKAAVTLVHLVYDIYITLGRVVAKVNVDMITVGSLSIFDIPIVIVHRCAPKNFSVCILLLTHTAFRILYADVVTVNFDMPFLIVACLFLSLGRLCIYLLALCIYLFRSISCA